MSRFIIITDSSVWLVEQGEASTHIVDRATWGSPYIEDGRRFAGQVFDGDLKVGSRLMFNNVYPNSYGNTDRVVMTGVIVSVIRLQA